MKIVYAVFSGAVLAIGVLHMATTFRLSSPAASKIWFFGAGISLVLAGLLNLLNRQYGLHAFGLRASAILTNLFMLVFAIVAGQVTNARVAEKVVMLGLLTAVLILSLLPGASLNSQSMSPTETP